MMGWGIGSSSHQCLSLVDYVRGAEAHRSGGRWRRASMLVLLYSTWPLVSASSTSAAVTVPVQERWPDVSPAAGALEYTQNIQGARSAATAKSG